MTAMLAMSASLVLVLLAPMWFDRAELTAKPGGKVKVEYNPPMWNEKFESQIKPGQPWRLGSNGATTIESEAGLLFDGFTFFPGKCDLGAVLVSGDDWQLLFHHGGPFDTEKGREGEAKCKADTLTGKKVTKKLVIELQKAKEGGYEFVASFGPHTMKSPFTTVKAQTAKAKCVKSAFACTWLEIPESEATTKKLEGDGLCVARLESKDLDEPVRVVLKGGEKPTLDLVSGKKDASPIHVEGTSAKAAAKAAAMTCAVASGEQSATLTFTLGDAQYAFQVGPEVFDKY